MIASLQLTSTVRRVRCSSVLAATAALMLSGCAKFSVDGGMNFVKSEAGGELHKDVVKIRTEADAAAAKARIKSLLAKPLTADTAVQIALLNNRGLQAAFSELGVSEAQMVEASLPPSPTLSLARIVATGKLEIERMFRHEQHVGLAIRAAERDIARVTAHHFDNRDSPMALSRGA